MAFTNNQIGIYPITPVTSQEVVLSSAFTFPSATSIIDQVITGMSLVLQPGTYFISYSCSLELTMNPSAAGVYQLQSVIYITSPINAPLTEFRSNACRRSDAAAVTTMRSLGGTASAIGIQTFTVPTTIQLTGRITSNQGTNTALIANFASLIALKLA